MPDLAYSTALLEHDWKRTIHQGSSTDRGLVVVAALTKYLQCRYGFHQSRIIFSEIANMGFSYLIS